MANPFGKASWNQSAYARQRWQKDYDDYLKRIEQYKGSSFYNELLNNPYYQFQDYQANFFQGVWANTFEDYSAWDKFYNDRKTSGDEYLAQIIDAQRQQQYSDPQAEVARRQAAGLNDDLNGGQAIGTGEPGAAAPDDTPPESSFTDPLAQAGEIAGLGFQMFQSMMSLGNFFQDFIGKGIQNAAGDISLTDQGYDSMIKLMAGSSSLPGSRDEYDALSEEEKKGLDDTLIEQLDAAIKTGSLKGMYSTRRAKQLMKLLQGRISYDKNGKPTLAYEAYRSKLLAQRYGDHKSAAESVGTIGFSEDLMTFAGNISEIFGDLDLRLRKAQAKAAEASARSAETNAAYGESYNGVTVDGESVATSDAKAAIAGNMAEVEAAEQRKLQAELDRIIDEEFQKLNQMCTSGNEWYHTIGRMLIPVARAYVYRVMAASRTTSSGTKGKQPFSSTSITF